MSIFQSFYCIELHYLSDSVTMMEDVPWHVVYGFVNNRCQSVRQDITYQVLTTHNHLHATVSAPTILLTLTARRAQVTLNIRALYTTVGKEASHIEIIIVPNHPATGGSSSSTHIQAISKVLHLRSVQVNKHRTLAVSPGDWRQQGSVTNTVKQGR